MKLVDILARELEVWPAHTKAIEQDRKGYCIYNAGGGPLEEHIQSVAEDAETAVVTREQWQAAVDALNGDSSSIPYAQVFGRGKRVVPWNGEGLPPVGIDCEVLAGYSNPRFDRFIGQRVHIIAHDVINGDPVAVFRMPVDGDDTEQDYHAMVAGSFRPLRTAEQIKADERSLAVADMVKSCPYPGAACTVTACAALYDAGYRKFEIVESES